MIETEIRKEAIMVNMKNKTACLSLVPTNQIHDNDLAGKGNLRHIAIIMDGNGRWAKAQGKLKIAGHRKGAEIARLITEATAKQGIAYLTLYSFSSENWQRPPDEVNDLMNLLRRYLKQEAKTLRKNNIQLRVIGGRDRLPEDILKTIGQIEAEQLENPKLTVIMALNYGARQEMISAVQKIVSDVQQGRININDINQNLMAKSLDTESIPDPDMIIRTGGELRLSNFLLWQAAYSELFFTPTLWPDFSVEEYTKMIQQFFGRERRYGNTR